MQIYRYRSIYTDNCMAAARGPMDGYIARYIYVFFFVRSPRNYREPALPSPYMSHCLRELETQTLTALVHTTCGPAGKTGDPHRYQPE